MAEKTRNVALSANENCHPPPPKGGGGGRERKRGMKIASRE